MTGNGSGSLTYRWLAGILVTLLIAATVAWARNIQNHVDAIETQQSDGREWRGRIEVQLQNVDARTARIETKLDNLGAHP